MSVNCYVIRWLELPLWGENCASLNCAFEKIRSSKITFVSAYVVSFPSPAPYVNTILAPSPNSSGSFRTFLKSYGHVGEESLFKHHYFPEFLIVVVLFKMMDSLRAIEIVFKYLHAMSRQLSKFSLSTDNLLRNCKEGNARSEQCFF